MGLGALDRDADVFFYEFNDPGAPAPEPLTTLPFPVGASHSLERVLPPWFSEPIPVHAVYLDRKFVPAKLQTFLLELTRFKTTLWRKELPT